MSTPAHHSRFSMCFVSSGWHSVIQMTSPGDVPCGDGDGGGGRRMYFDVKEQPGAARTRSPHPGLDIDAEVGVGLEGERGEVGRAGVEPRAVCRRNAAARRLVGDEGRGEGERWDVKSVLCAGRQCGGLVSEMAPVRVLTGAEKRERGEREK